MQTKKMSLANMEGKLSRTEMKNIMAGTGGNQCNVYCTLNSQCDSTCSNCVDAGNGRGTGPSQQKLCAKYA